MKNVTIVACRTFTREWRSAGLFPPCGDPSGCPDSSETVRPQDRNHSTTRSYGNSKNIAFTAS